MSRFERYGFLRVLLAGLFVWFVVGAHLVLTVAAVVGTGLVVLAAWRWLGAAVRRRLESSRWRLP